MLWSPALSFLVGSGRTLDCLFGSKVLRSSLSDYDIASRMCKPKLCFSQSWFVNRAPRPPHKVDENLYHYGSRLCFTRTPNSLVHYSFFCETFLMAVLALFGDSFSPRNRAVIAYIASATTPPMRARNTGSTKYCNKDKRHTSTCSDNRMIITFPSLSPKGVTRDVCAFILHALA